MMELDIQYYLEVKNNDSTFNRVRCLISVKSGITDIISHNYAKIIQFFTSRKNNNFS